MAGREPRAGTQPVDAATRDRLIRLWSRKVKDKLDEVLPAKPNEATLRHAVEPLLDQFCAEVGVPPLEHAERSLASGIADAVFNRFVIEYKRPGVMSPKVDLATSRALDQLKSYMRDIAKSEGRQDKNLGGVIFDGCHIVFLRLQERRFHERPPVVVSEYSLGLLLRWLAGLASGRALTAKNLRQDFTVEQPQVRGILGAFYGSLCGKLGKPEGLVTKLFEQWRLFFSESIGYSEAFGGHKLEPLKNWVTKAGIDVENARDAERFFFALHTYFALLVKLLAWLALSRHVGGKLGGPSFSELAGADSSTLLGKLREMENGGIFRAFGITNLLEGDFFAWYLHAWNEEMERGIREMLALLDRYDPATLAIQPEETRDLFKKLYHYLLPREIRHNLGEYYTPDWLAQHLLRQVDKDYFESDVHRRERELVEKLAKTRFLDPACGSGTFLVLVISRMRRLGSDLMIKEAELLDRILENVVGIDLNPLAVLTARVNYLLAVSDLLEHRRGEISIPVYIADSISVRPEDEGTTPVETQDFRTAIGRLMVPIQLCRPDRFDRFCDMLERHLADGQPFENFGQRLATSLKLDREEWTANADLYLRKLYERLTEVHRDKIDGLWVRLLKNNFAPFAIGQFDYVVGNPPWVNWESLPDEYRRETRTLWDRYGLFPHKGMDVILGKGKKDISMLMTYVVADQLLKDGGKLGFVITQSVFKTAGAGQGFRCFQIPHKRTSDTPLRVLYVDDMVDLNPFEGASNRTALVVLEKGRPAGYPFKNYILWRKYKGPRFNHDSTLAEVEHATTRTYLHAITVDESDPTSAWLTAKPRALSAVKKLLGRSDYVAREGSNTGGANAVYWVETVGKRPDGLLVIKNVTENAKVKVEEVIKPVESDLLYPLLRGRDVSRWQADPSASIMMAQDPAERRGYAEKRMQEEWPHTLAYLKLFERTLRGRAAFKRYFEPDRDPFYSMFNISDYTFAPWKVVWREVANALDAAVAGPVHTKVTVPDHTLIMVDCASEAESHYLCATLNSAPARHVVRAYIVLHPDPHILEHIRVPKFDPGNPVHRRLSELSMQAHEATKTGDTTKVVAIETEVDLQTAKLWGLTDAELAEIQRNLKELTE